ncbi:MAG TPA: TonB-dependent receptor, partial [Acidobacteriota bacterium]
MSFRKAGVFLMIFAFMSAIAVAQETTGTIVGTISDHSGAVVPGVTVTVTNVDKNVVVRSIVSDDQGNYSAPLLPIGHYTITVELQGFKKESRTNIELNVNEKLTENFTLELGEVSEVVTVDAGALQVELQTPTSAGLIDGTQVRELSLNNRNYLQLVTLMPGVSSGASDQLYIGTTNPSGQTNVVSFSINGNRNSANNWTVDGADNVDRGSNLTLLNYPSVDAIAEFKVLRGLYSAEFGRSASGQVNVITRSGTKDFHGSAYEFFRNDVLAANAFFNNARGIKRPPLRYNNFGYTFGGPVYIPGHYNTEKNKTFFFWSQEFRRVIAPATLQATVPLSDEKKGIFANPVCVAASGSTCTQTATQITNINPVAQAYINDIWSKIPGDNRVLFSSVRSVYNHRQELIKLDHVFGPKLSISGRYLNDTIPTVEPGGLFTGAVLPEVATTSTDSPGHSWVFHATSAFSPTWLNEAGYAFSYGAIVSRVQGLISSNRSPDIRVGLPYPSTLGRVPGLSITGLSSITGFGPYDDFNRNHSIHDNMTKILGRHSFKFGFTWNHYQKTENAAGNNTGTFSFGSTFGSAPRPSGTATFQQAWANFLMGNLATFTQASIDLTPDIRTNQFEGYVQDDFRVQPNLTVNLGVRYSAFRQPHDVKGML